MKTTDLTAPGPANTFVFLDMRPDEINWGNFFTDMTGYSNNPAAYTFQDLPGMIHDVGCGFSFADGRAEIHRWRDQRTTPSLNGLSLPGGMVSPRNEDITWLQNHSTSLK